MVQSPFSDLDDNESFNMHGTLQVMDSCVVDHPGPDDPGSSLELEDHGRGGAGYTVGALRSSRDGQEMVYTNEEDSINISL